MGARGPLGPQQTRWIARIQSAGGMVEYEDGRNATGSAWIPIEGGRSIQIPMRMFESLVERDILVVDEQPGLGWSAWRLEESDGEETTTANPQPAEIEAAGEVSFDPSAQA